MKLNSQALELFMISSLTGITLVLSGYIYSGLYGALNVGVGAAVSLINIQFYALIFWRIFTKKNIASLGLLIVIKYTILLLLIYFVWAYCDVLMSVAGLVSELIITALVWLLVRLVRQ